MLYHIANAQHKIDCRLSKHTLRMWFDIFHCTLVCIDVAELKKESNLDRLYQKGPLLTPIASCDAMIR